MLFGLYSSLLGHGNPGGKGAGISGRWAKGVAPCLSGVALSCLQKKLLLRLALQVLFSRPLRSWSENEKFPEDLEKKNGADQGLLQI